MRSLIRVNRFLVRFIWFSFCVCVFSYLMIMIMIMMMVINFQRRAVVDNVFSLCVLYRWCAALLAAIRTRGYSSPRLRT